MSKNPLEIFGLTPEFVASLSEKELFLIIKSLYRSILKTVHPDLAVKDFKKQIKFIKKSVQINLAFEALNLEKNLSSFRKHRKEYIARSSNIVYKKNLKLQGELLAKDFERKDVLNSYFKYLLGKVPWNLDVGLEKNNFKSIKIGLLDVALNQNLQQAKWIVGSNYKQILIDENGQIFLRQIGRSNFTEVNYIYLLGVSDIDKVKLLSVLEKEKPHFFRTAISTGSVAYGVGNSVENKISEDNFKKFILPNLKSELKEQCYLFSLNKAEYKETALITLEGLIVKIEKN